MSHLPDRFSALPPEIRLEICNFLIKEVIPLVEYDGASPPTSRCGILSLAQTSQLLRGESLPVFKQHASVRLRLSSVVEFLHTFAAPGVKTVRLVVDTRAGLDDASPAFDLLPLLAHVRNVQKRELRSVEFEFVEEDGVLGRLLDEAVSAARLDDWITAVHMSNVQSILIRHNRKKIEVNVDVESMHMDASDDDDELLTALGLEQAQNSNGAWTAEVIRS